MLSTAKTPSLSGCERYRCMTTTDRAAIGAKRRDVDVLMSTPTKHYIRQEIWLPAAIRRGSQLGRPITYFTLTTPDLLDIKVLDRAGLLERTQRGYPGIGFCEKDDKTYSDIIRRLQWCPLSYKGSFEDMALEEDDFGSRFGFDTVNLDFTWVPFAENESPLDGTWGAIRRVLEVQYEKRISFDLFLTFRGSLEGTDQNSIAKLVDLLAINLSDGRGVGEFDKRVGHLDVDRLLSEDYLTFLALGLPKLLVGDALEIGFHVSNPNVYSYQRVGSEETYNIIKFVFGLEVPESAEREFGAVPGLIQHYDTVVPEIFSAHIVDVDDIVRSDSILVSALNDDMYELKALV